ncbi:MAG: multiheme c-type cytochrome [Planctomycetota bacterium]|nr:multiheme c-type cytochrome [Planctomycetota bacterium]
MNFATRVGIATALLAAFGGAIAFLSVGSRTQPVAQGTVRWESSAQCKACHEDVFAEWYGSHHQIAFLNPEVRAQSEDFRKEECMDCHLPRPLAVTGFGKLPLPRRTHFDEGVSCISCHLGPDGGILARNDRPEVPCKTKRSEEFFAVDTCASCHNQHLTTDQWRASRFATLGTDCSACHMPEVPRARSDKSTRMGRSHAFPGAHDKAMLQKAATFAVTHEGNEVVLALTNVGAGHNFPTEERHRAVDMLYRFVTKDGAAATWTLAHRARQPYRDESQPVTAGAASGENTQLPASATKAVRLPIPAGAIAVEARLWYRLTPFCGDDSPMSTLLEERRLDLP